MEALASLWRSVGGDPSELERAEITGRDPVLPAAFRIGDAAAAALAAVALVAGDGPVRVDTRHAAALARSERHLRVGGAPPPDPWSPASGFYETADGWLQLHGNFPHHLAAAGRALDAAPERPALAAVLRRCAAADAEDAIVAAGGCAAAARTASQWLATPQGQAAGDEPLVQIDQVADAPPAAGGVQRVLDLSRVIAGPVAGRTLAALGADVLRVGADHLATIPALVLDTGFGKRFAHLDARTPDGRQRLVELARTADVVVDAYRPGALAALGVGPGTAAGVHVSLSAWGHAGPWSGRRGYDSLVQTATGIALEHGGGTPRHLPAQVLDHVTGYLAALGALLALRRRAAEGGAWHVRVSLAATAAWLDRLGRVEAGGVPDWRQDDVADLLDTMPSPHGDLTFVRPAVGRYAAPPPLPGADEPAWRR